MRRYVGSLGGLTALLGLFLPFVGETSFFESVSGPEWGFFAPAAVLAIALPTLLCALGRFNGSAVLGGALFWLYLLFPGAMIYRSGLTCLRIGAWLTLFGLFCLGFPGRFPS